jgi:hypothetical protein
VKYEGNVIILWNIAGRDIKIHSPTRGQEKSGRTPNHTLWMYHLLYKHAWRKLIIKETAIKKKYGAFCASTILTQTAFISSSFWCLVASRICFKGTQPAQDDGDGWGLPQYLYLSPDRGETQHPCHREDVINNVDLHSETRSSGKNSSHLNTQPASQ